MSIFEKMMLPGVEECLSDLKENILQSIKNKEINLEFPNGIPKEGDLVRLTKLYDLDVVDDVSYSVLIVEAKVRNRVADFDFQEGEFRLTQVTFTLDYFCSEDGDEFENIDYDLEKDIYQDEDGDEVLIEVI